MTDFAAITPCGESCKGCEKRKSGFCSGCRESGGLCKEWEQSGGCPIYACAERHGALFCGLCGEFPSCSFLSEKITWNKRIVEEQTVLAEEYNKEKTARCGGKNKGENANV